MGKKSRKVEKSGKNIEILRRSGEQGGGTDAVLWEVTLSNIANHRVKTVLQDLSSGGGVMKESNIMRIKKTDDLPFIPALLRDFAYKYAMGEYKSQESWGVEFGVKAGTISRWLKHAGVRDYIMICQARKKRGYLSEIRRRLREKRDRMTCL